MESWLILKQIDLCYNIKSMKLRQIIQNHIIQAQKEKNQARLDALRYLFAQINDREIEKGRKELSDQEIIDLINNQIKKLNEAKDMFFRGGRQELVQKTDNEIKLLKSYLPKQLSDEELEEEINKLIKANPQMPHPGALIGLAVKSLQGRADNKRVSQIILSKFKK